MADNVNITAGSGIVIHADEYTHITLGSGKTQLVKLVDGVLDSETPITVDVGAKANALRVAPANDITDATYIGDIKFGESLPAGTNAIGKLSANSGVDIGDVTLTAGTAAIGKLAANSGVDIGDVDIISIVPGVAATNLGKAEDAGHTTGDVGIMALTVRQDTAAALSGTDVDYQPLITDANGRLHVLDQNSAAMLTALQILDDWDDANYCNVNINIAGTDCDGGSGAQGAQTLRVILATDDPGVALLTTIDSDTNDIKTAVEIMDDWDATHASAAPADGAQIMGAAYSTALPTDVGADADAARLVTDRYGRLCTGLQPQAGTATLDNADTTTAREIVAATASRKIYITSFILSVDTAGNYWLEDGDATAVTGKFYLAANGGCAPIFPEGTPLSTAVVNKALNVKGSTAGNVSVTVTYYLAP